MNSKFSEFDKPEQKHRLLMEFGIVIAPLDELAQRATPPTLEEYRFALGKFNVALGRWIENFRTFSQFGEVSYISYGELSDALEINIDGYIRHSAYPNPIELPVLQDKLKSSLQGLTARCIEMINLVPVNWPPILYDAKTPFTVYMRIQDAIAGARQRIDYFDRYLTEDFFHLYLRHLDRSLAVRLITTHGPGKDKHRPFGVEGVKPISDLVRQEFTDYKLVEVTPQAMHGRQLRVDDQIFALDVGTSDAGRYPTHFSRGDSSITAHQILDNIIKSGSIIHTS